ncbi:hypothetical protein BCR42DRAFT_355612 [Absidia repens]|uniref:PIPK domain-containing protein n=1 Tax=Absidia repens TaxID=90262 RepID=A0A1X2IBE0_9FUNG|nr:hypothetical protein BCR42DRAFT_355612 [Absidia repens]
MAALPSSPKSLPLLPKTLDLPPTNKQQSFTSPMPFTKQLDDEAKVYFWKLIHTWLRYEKLQARWASVINDILLLILQTRISETPSSIDGGAPLYMYIQLFETGSATQSKYLPSVTHGTQLQSLTDLPLPTVYGGTIRLYGAPQSLQQTLTDIIAISLYTLYSLHLETGVMYDHLVAVSTQLSRKHDLQSTNNPDNGAPWKFGLLGWLLGKTDDKLTDAKIQHSEKPSATSPINGTPKRRLSAMAFKYLAKKPADNGIILPTKTSSLNRDLSDLHYYKNLQLGLERACVSTSPSCLFVAPSIVTVLEKEEDNMNTMKMIITKGLQEQKLHKNNQRSSDQLLRNKLTSLARRSSSILSLGSSSTTEEAKENIPSNIILPQSITAYSLLRIPKTTLNDTNKIGLDHLYLDTASTDAFMYHQHIVIDYMAYPIGCPDRPCLGPNLCTIEYFRFGDQSPYSDETLGATVERWLRECNTPCKNRIDQQTTMCCEYMNNTQSSPKLMDQQQQPSKTHKQATMVSNHSEANGMVSPTTQKQQRSNNTKMLQHGCKQPLQDHVLCFGHDSSRINVYFVSTSSTADTSINGNDTINGNNDFGVDVLRCWLACSICDARTQPRCVSQATYQFSFGKYLELYLYSTRFNGPHDDLCQHAKTTPTAIARCFGAAPKSNNQGMDHHTTTQSMEIRFLKEDIKVYRLRGSPLQVVQPAATSTSPSSTLSPRISKSTMEKWIIREQRAVDDLFKSMRRHLSYLQDNRLNGRADTDIVDWRATLDLDHQHLSSVLKKPSNGKDGCINDFRRLFTLRASSVVDDLNAWQLQRWPSEQGQSKDLFTWKARPDYMNTDVNQTIHCFPDSAIMVRELEPTSIIAYTLSSNEYVEELEQTRSLTSNTDTIPTNTATSLSMSPETMTSPALSTKSNNDGSNKNITNNSDDGDQNEVIDGYYSTVERKYIASATGSATETASFRTMILETVRSNVNDEHTHRLSQMKKRLARATPFLPSSDKIQQQEKTERNLDLSSQQSAKDIKESTIYHNPPPPSDSHARLADDNLNHGSTTNPDAGQSSAKLETASSLVSPHIKHRFVHGDKEFTCVVYYANEFELLRRSCGVEQLVIESLGRCQNWGATGGKSKSQFYKTQDDRLVVKEMMNAWNIAEKDAFLRFAPKYFDYVKESGSAPTILAKIFGFYSVQIRTLNEKKELLNMDVLVMEQLFYGQSIDKTFDFKGIPDRQVDEELRNQQHTTLWDGDWRDGYRMGYVTHEQSKEWIEAAIHRDTEFLAKGNIMDYSLLVGVDNDKKELTVGIVDFIGAYTWYKKLESRSKSTIHRNREVTVLPPDQYRLRFCREVFNYFIPIPGKFDKILPEQTCPSIWMK